MKAAWWGIFVCLLTVCGIAQACPPPHRDRAQMRAFEKTHPCPATGKTYGPCHGFVVDHRRPLCADGIDAPVNMAWEELIESRVKDREELRLCEMVKKGTVPHRASTADICKVIAVSNMPLMQKSACEVP